MNKALAKAITADQVARRVYGKSLRKLVQEHYGFSRPISARLARNELAAIARQARKGSK